MPARKTRAAKTERAKTANLQVEEHADDGASSNNQQSEQSLFSSEGETGNVNATQRTGVSSPLTQLSLQENDGIESSMEVSQASSEDIRPANH
jgi:hypothetical protein